MSIRVGDLKLDPYVLGTRDLSPALFERMPDDALALDLLGRGTQTSFAFLLNAANALAFGDLGMPLWVQLDCAMLPSAYHGFALPRGDLPDGLWDRIFAAVADGRVPADVVARLADYAGPVPVSGFAAAPTGVPGAVVGFSLFSLVPGLGVRTKALGLRAHDARRQVGVTQYDNPVLRVHTAFGRLEILEPRMRLHTRPMSTFVYALDVPAPEVLEAMAFEGARPVSPVPHAEPVSDPEALDREPRVTLVVSDETGTQLERLSRGKGRVWIVPPGSVSARGRTCVVVETDAPHSPGDSRR